MTASVRLPPGPFSFPALVCILITLGCNPNPFADLDGGPRGGGDNQSGTGGASGGTASDGGGSSSASGGGDSTANGGGNASNGGGTSPGNGGGSASGGGPAGSSVLIDMYCATRAPIVCDSYYLRCNLMFSAERAKCITTVRTNCERQRLAEVKAGSASYDPIKAAQCLNKISSMHCSALQRGAVTCSEAFQTGIGKQGTDCSGNENCQSDAGFVCLFNESCSTCGAPPRLGQKCGVGSNLIANCAGDSYCAYVTDGGTRLCVPRLPAGNECRQPTDCQAGTRCGYAQDSGTLYRCFKLSADGAACYYDEECATGVCNFGIRDGGPPRCGAAALGSPCREQLDCGAGNYCRGLGRNLDGGIQWGTCAVKNSDGAACENNDLPSDSCANAGATCLDGKCVVTPPSSRTVGQSCDAPTQCSNGTNCIVVDVITREGKCLATVAPGARCNPGSCPFGYGCIREANEDAGTCTSTRVKENQACQTPARNCSLLATCHSQTDGGGTCQAYYASVGESCQGPCINSFCKQDAGTCTPYQPLGAFCENDDQCESGVCRKDASRGKCVAACL